VPAPRPRRVSGPARPARLRQPVTGAVAAERGLALGLLELLQSISRHSALDRLIRGRAWIAIVVFALLGIVTLQLTLLKLNAGIGRSLERGALLQRENAALSIENSELAAGARIEAQAEHLGMSLVPAGSLKFLRAHPRSDQAHAAAALSAPVPSIASAETASAQVASGSSSETGAGTESSEHTATSASSSAEGEGTATTSSTAGEATSQETAPASHESSTSPASSASEAPSTSAGVSASGPGGGTEAGPTG
jgi:cell division protein FtsL